MHQEVGAGCPGSLDGLPGLLLSELKLTQTHMQINADTHSDEDTNADRQTPLHTHMHAHLVCVVYVAAVWGQCLYFYGSLSAGGRSSICHRTFNIHKRGTFINDEMMLQIQTHNSRCPAPPDFRRFHVLLCVALLPFDSLEFPRRIVPQSAEQKRVT